MDTEVKLRAAIIIHQLQTSCANNAAAGVMYLATMRRYLAQ